ncbi:MAG: BlaI/MecI/CopY family transcriptional regulator [Planctomycetaceae bacterium]|nr:BlaI/MecI/CopY family transcriptional regulator [Planctomycetaceae bacterium]
MPRTPQDITDAELSVLQALWDRGTATVRELTEQLYKECTLSLTATVQKLLERLEGKKCVKRDRNTWPHSFSPTLKRDELIARQLQTTANKLCEGDLHPLLTCLVKTRGLTAEDRLSLRGLLDELDKQKS